MDLQMIMQLVSQIGICGTLLFVALWYYDRRIRPEQVKKDAELAATNAAILKDQIDENRRQREDAFKREMEIRNEHREAWDMMRKQHKEERQQDMLHQERLLERIAVAIDNNTAGLDRNFGLTMTIGKNLGFRKTDMVKETEMITGKPVDKKYATNHGEETPSQ